MVESAKAFPGLDYETLESAVLESSRGRWFLEEFARRHRSADTTLLVEAIKKLENVISTASSSVENAGAEKAEITALLHSIRNTRSEIAAVRNHLLSDGGVIANDEHLYGKLAAAAKSAADTLMTRTEALQHTSIALKSADPDGPFSPQIDTQLAGLQSLAWSQDVLSQRVAKAMGLLSHIDERIAHLAGEPQRPPVPAAPEKKNLPFFMQDEDIFEPVRNDEAHKPKLSAVPPAATPQPQPEVTAAGDPEKRARVIVKRYKPEDQGVSDMPPEITTASDFEPPEPAPAAQPETPATPPAVAREEPQPERKRVVIVRRKSGEVSDIPLAGHDPLAAAS